MIPIAGTLMRYRRLFFFLALTYALSLHALAAPVDSPCRIQDTNYQGWHAQQIANQWIQLIIVPQNGGRLMQVFFAGHPYLFVNPKYAGKYLPPSQDQWFNYGGDKIWLLPEGNNDEQHWRGNSDILDDGPFSFRIVSQDQICAIELTSPPDPQTGVQFIRTISLADSPRIQFHTVMKNVTGHTVEWSMQSVSQYDTSDPASRARRNPDFWAFTPANPQSSYLNRYHVRFGPAENPAASVRDDGLFALHYAHMATEFWLDSTAGWLAVVDATTHYAMLERFHYDETRPYPGKASIIFWTNGPETHLNPEGEPVLSAGDEAPQPPYYQEAELNSPLCRLRPGESCTFDTEWFPTRGDSEFHGATDAGIITHPLGATGLANGKIKLIGSFGVFFEGHLIAHFYNDHGASLGTVSVAEANPTHFVSLDTEIAPPAKPARLSLHLQDASGLDRGSLGEVPIATGDNR